VYWAIVTLTTVGFGDITPQTALGRALASLMMLIGWGILAVPTGIVTAEMTAQRFGLRPGPRRACSACGAQGHEADARYCRRCAAQLPEME
jgi:voltage-gated potassium channel